MAKKGIHNLLLVIVLGMGVAVWMSWGHREALAKLWNGIDIRWLVLGAGSFIGYLSCEAIAFHRLLEVLGERRGFFRCLYYACADFFFSSVTPGGAGGQPGQYAAMTKDGLSAPVILLSLFSFNLIYHIVLLGWIACGACAGMLQMAWQISLLRPLITFGILAQSYFVVQFFLILFWPKVSDCVIEGILSVAKRWRFMSGVASREAEIREKHAVYRSLAACLKRDWKRLVRPCLWILPMLAASYSVAFAVYRSMDGGTLGWISFILLQGVATVATESVPLPAGIGAVEGGHGLLYQTLLGLEKGIFLVGCTRLLWLYGGLIFAGAGMISFRLWKGKTDGKMNGSYI